MTTAPDSPRVAIVGARGIGRHHARWWHLSGADVCAHVGTSDASIAEATEKLRGLFDYQGQGYSELGEMLAREQPDWVDVACTTPAHYAVIRTCLEAGAHVLAEKPLVYDSELSAVELLAQTNELLAIAEHRGLRLGLCSQFCQVAQVSHALFRQQRGDEAVREVQVEIASPVRGRPPVPLGTWIDLGPHALTIMQTIARLEGVDVPPQPVPLGVHMFEGYQAECAFELPGLACRLKTGRTTGEPANIRQIRLNGMSFDLDGENDEQGIYRGRVDFPGGSHLCDDPMHQLIARCVAGDPPLTGEMIRRNQSWLLAIGKAG